MCFNPAKNWQLGWFDESGETTTFTSPGSVTYEMVGVSRANAQSGKYVVVKVPNGSPALYDGYNRKPGIHKGTVEDDDRVTIL